MDRPADEESELSYSQATARLDEIIREIEEGEVDIDELSTRVKEAARLIRLCQDKIQAAKVDVEEIAEQLKHETEIGVQKDSVEEQPEIDSVPGGTSKPSSADEEVPFS